MKGFKRNNTLLSLCGLNCGLCPLKLGGHCMGCGNGNQSCKIAKCSMAHDQVEYCSLCHEYPCSLYEHIDQYDSFITHQNQKANLEKAQSIGEANYNIEQIEKIKLLNTLLNQYNDGRRKTLYCIAVNLLEVNEIQNIIHSVEENPQLRESTLSEKADYISKMLQELAAKKNILLKLRKK